jgi:hypothetical protein
MYILYSPVALQSLKDLGRLTYRRFLPRTSDQPVARPLHTQDNTTQKDADKHPCLERDSNPRSQQPTGQDARLIPHGHCDRRTYCIVYQNIPVQLVLVTINVNRCPEFWVVFSRFRHPLTRHGVGLESTFLCPVTNENRKLVYYGSKNLHFQNVKSCLFGYFLCISITMLSSYRPVVPKRCVATPWCVGRDHEVCREIKKNLN